MIGRAADVDSMMQAGMRVPPESLQRVIHAQSVSAGAVENLVGGTDCPPRRSDLVPARSRPGLEVNFLARLDEIPDAVHVREQLLAGRVDFGGGFTQRVQDVRIVLMAVPLAPTRARW